MVKTVLRYLYAGISLEEVRADLLRNEGFAAEYEKLRPGYEAIEQIVKAGKEQNITQEELAGCIGTQKSNISRLESGNYNPALDLLIKIAGAPGKKLNVQLQ